MDDKKINGGLYFTCLLKPEQYAEWQSFSKSEVKAMQFKVSDYVKYLLEEHAYFKELDKE